MNKFNELIAKLREILQIDRPDLDFGIYRIINARAAEIEKFLTATLPEKVRQSLAAGGENDTAGLQSALDKAVSNARELGADPEGLPKVKELRQQIAEASAGTVDYESRVYAHLLQFFSRYYDKGDFISKRRYKGDTYAIPYAGEEVKLYWANFDQYYTKSGENFSNYTLKLADDKRVHFRLVSADTAKDNRKDNELERCFVLFQPRDTETQSLEAGDEAEAGNDEGSSLPDDFIEANGDDLTIYFEYKPMPKGTKQTELVQQAIKSITEKLNAIIVSASAPLRLCVNELLTACPTPKNPERTRLEKALTDYVSKNTADYFIHKDLGKFLRRELDFYIKNEMMNLDDIQHIKAFKEIEKNLKMIQCMRFIAGELITFMAQLEDFQKKLWLKKKFVVETNYCITLDRVPETLRNEIFENKAQLAEWEKLGILNTETQRHGDELDLFNNPSAPPYLRVENSFMTVDTKFFNADFKAKLLASIGNIDEQCDGLLIHSENFQALNLLQERYKEQIKCIYIDPPFNLKQNGDFLYRTDYKDSTWLSLLFDRVCLGRHLLSNTGIFFIRCDYNGNYLVRDIGDTIFGGDMLQGEFLVQRIRKNVTDQGKITLPLANDSLFLYFKTENSQYVNPYLKLNEVREAYWRRIDDSAGFRNPPERIIFGAKFFPYKRDAHFKYSQASIERMILEQKIRLKCKNCPHIHVSGTWVTCPKCGSEEATPQYRVEATDKKILDTNWMDIAGYSSTTGFSTENSEVLLERVMNVSTNENDIILDFFAGSGTTIAVATKKNRKWISVELGTQFYLHILPRLKKCVGRSRFFTYLRLESYEDTLNNLELKRDKIQGELLSELPESVRSEYLLKYMLDIECRGSILSTDKFKKPFDYALNIAADSAGATTRQSIDLVETFNYLIGLRLKTYNYRPERGIAIIEGTLPDGESTLILWRDCDKVGYEELNKYCESLNINPKSSHYDVVYVNGDHGIANQTQSLESEGGITKLLKLRQIEEEFLTRMFMEV